MSPEMEGPMGTIPLALVQPTAFHTTVHESKVELTDGTKLDRVLLQLETPIGSLHFFFDKEMAETLARALFDVTKGIKKDPSSALQVVQDIPDAIKRRNHAGD